MGDRRRRPRERPRLPLEAVFRTLALIVVARVVAARSHRQQLADPISSSRARAWTSVVLGLAGVLTMPAAVVVSRQSQRVSLMDAAYAVPLAFVLGVLALGMGRRAKRNLAWLRLNGRGTGAASTGAILGLLAVALALTAALSVGFYEAVLYYQHHYH